MQVKDFFIKNKKEIFVFVGIAILFVLLRVPAIHHPYHQDEYKWPIIVNPALTEPGGIPHPPLGEAIYRTTFYLLGSDNFRVTPLIFGFANLILVYLIVRRRYSVKAALWSALFFTLSYYSVLASLMVDTDGQILPFFLLLALWFYDSFNFSYGKIKWLWLGLFFGALIAGMMVKMSFILAIGAFFIDFIIEKGVFKDKKRVAKTVGWGILGVFALAAVLYFSKFIFPFFNLESSVKYWESFVKGFGSRNFLQTGIQFVKALFYLSPALVFGGLLSLYPYRRDLKLFHIFIGLGLVFYLIVFDFSGGALDRYFQFLIIPLCIISGVLFSKLSSPFAKGERKKTVLLLCLVPLFIFALHFINQYVPPLHPKTEWINRVISLKWNFLFPFTGGSGPLGFYISFLFIAASYVYTAILAALMYIKKEFKFEFFAAILVVGLVYNFSFAEEYLFGKINGSSPVLVKEAVAFINNDPDIKYVTVYNDNGGYEVQKIGKYRKRLYTSPAFDVNEKISTLNKYKEHYLEVNVPPMDLHSVYRKYLDSCKIIYNKTDGYISATVHDCRKVPDVSI